MWWAPLHRQVRVEGRCERLPASESDAYFASRPAASNLSALASEQSAPIADRSALEDRVDAARERQAGAAPPRPESWGGYLLRPAVVEFWQGRGDRLHDRLEYRREAGGEWSLTRLSP